MEHASSDVDASRVLKIASGFVLVGATLLVGLWGLLGHWDRRALAAETAPMKTRSHPPAPRLQIDPRADLATMRAEEDAVLTSYGWVDANAGIVRLPINAAIEFVARQGREPELREAPAPTADTR